MIHNIQECTEVCNKLKILIGQCLIEYEAIMDIYECRLYPHTPFEAVQQIPILICAYCITVGTIICHYIPEHCSEPMRCWQCSPQLDPLPSEVEKDRKLVTFYDVYTTSSEVGIIITVPPDTAFLFGTARKVKLSHQTLHHTKAESRNEATTIWEESHPVSPTLCFLSRHRVGLTTQDYIELLNCCTLTHTHTDLHQSTHTYVPTIIHQHTHAMLGYPCSCSHTMTHTNRFALPTDLHASMLTRTNFL